MSRGRARRYLLTKQGYYPGVVAAMGYDVYDWSTLNEGTMFQDSAKTTPASANGDVVGCWVDRVKLTDATQATTAVKPTLATASLNGLPTLSFDGGDLLATANISISTFAIWLVIVTSVTNVVIYATTSDETQLYNNTTDNLRIIAKRGATSSIKTSTQSTPNTASIIRHEFDGNHATHDLYINDTSQTMANTIAGDPGTGASIRPLAIGATTTGTFNFTGNIAQLCVVSPYPTDASILVNMESYINGIWGVY